MNSPSLSAFQLLSFVSQAAPSPREYLQHILDETTYIIISSADLDQETFVRDETLKRAYVRSIEVIGEAVKQLPNELRQK